MKKLKEKLTKYLFEVVLIILIILSIVLILAFLGCIGTCIYCWITYGGKPIEEIPLWALWFMFK